MWASSHNSVLAVSSLLLVPSLTDANWYSAATFVSGRVPFFTPILFGNQGRCVGRSFLENRSRSRHRAALRSYLFVNGLVLAFDLCHGILVVVGCSQAN